MCHLNETEIKTNGNGNATKYCTRNQIQYTVFDLYPGTW